MTIPLQRCYFQDRLAAAKQMEKMAKIDKGRNLILASTAVPDIVNYLVDPTTAEHLAAVLSHISMPDGSTAAVSASAELIQAGALPKVWKHISCSLSLSLSFFLSLYYTITTTTTTTTTITTVILNTILTPPPYHHRSAPAYDAALTHGPRYKFSILHHRSHKNT